MTEEELDPLWGIDLDALRVLSLTTKELIEQHFPGRVAITPEELAMVWKGKATRGVVEGIRERLKAGTLIPGLKKDGGRWSIPVASVVAVIDGMIDHAEKARSIQVTGPTATPVKRRRKTNIGPRPGIIGFEQSKEVWTVVFQTMMEMDAEELKADIWEGLGDKARLKPKGPPKDV